MFLFAQMNERHCDYSVSSEKVELCPPVILFDTRAEEKPFKYFIKRNSMPSLNVCSYNIHLNIYKMYNSGILQIDAISP